MIKKHIDYKKLWFEVCEEKKQLQLENHRLRENSNYYKKESEKFERMFQELNRKNHEPKRCGKTIRAKNYHGMVIENKCGENFCCSDCNKMILPHAKARGIKI